MIESASVEKCEVSSKQDDVKPKTVEFVMAAEPLQSSQVITWLLADFFLLMIVSEKV